MFLDRRPDERGEPAQSRPLEPQDDETQRLDEADQLYVDLNTLTGYGSYLEYFNAHQELTRELIQFFTVLAFIYITLNLATSIFGMNVYQLNQSGQHPSVFLTTALIAMLLTGTAWYLIELVNSYRKWEKLKYIKEPMRISQSNSR